MVHLFGTINLKMLDKMVCRSVEKIVPTNVLRHQAAHTLLGQLIMEVSINKALLILAALSYTAKYCNCDAVLY